MKRKSLTRFTAIVAIVGIAGGVAALILANALARGFHDEMQEKILANTSHITIFRKDGEHITEHLEVVPQITKIEGILSVDETTFESSILMGSKTNSYSVLRAISDSKPFDSGDITVGIGKELAEKTGLEVGDDAEIILPGDDSAKTAKVRIREIFRTGLFEYDSTWIYISFTDLAKLKGEVSAFPTVLSIKLTDSYDAAVISEQLKNSLSSDYKIVDWQEANQPLFAALSLEKKVSLAVIVLITLIALLNITTTLALLVNERRLDIAILQTCGAKTKSIAMIFLLQGFFLGLIGIICGVAIGLLASFSSNYFKLISLNTEVYSLESITLRISIFDIIFIAALVMFLTIIAASFPAFHAAKIKPLENLRNN
jgi:lipoprotein-releasing system permease protein